MKTWLLYLLQMLISSGILYGYYQFFLRNKKFHQYNRYYLLMATAISICIPFLHIPVYFDAAETEPVFLKTLTVFSSEGFEEDIIVGKTAAEADWFSGKNVLSFLYAIMAVFLFIRFLMALFRIVRMVNIYPCEKIDNIRFIKTSEPATPFSFFRWLFWNNKIELNSDNGQQIFRHELFHIRQKHSWDIVFLEIAAVIFWINPFFHLMKKEIKAIHEFLADKFAVEENKEWDYAELLLMQVLGSPNTRLTNPFFHNQIKRRIAMLTTSKKTGAQYLRKIMVLPLAAIVISLFAFSYKHRNENKKIWSEIPITIVVDAAHGGNDPGAKSPDEKYTEAQLSLEIAKVIQTMAKDYNVNVVMTRNNEAFPGGTLTKDEGLKKRVEITNEVKPDAFISIHINSTPPNQKYQSTLSGIETYVSRQRSDEKSKQLAAVILQELSAIYKTKQELKYRVQGGIWVLDQANCPAILLECGFINNARDLAFITNHANQEKIARSILEAVVTYKKQAVENTGLQISTDTVPPEMEKKTLIISHPDKIILQADSFVVHKKGDKSAIPNYKKSLIIINDRKQKPGVLNNNTVIADEVHFYSNGDPEAIRLYGNEAAEGLVIIKNAKIIEIPPGQYYKVEFSIADSKAGTNDTNNKIFEKLEIEPAFPGGEEAWKKYLSANLNAFIPVDSGAPGGKYTVFIQFIVDKEGNISDIMPLTKHGYGMEKEVIRIIGKGPKWLPGKQNGKTVKAYRKQPVTFVIEEENKLEPIKPDGIKPNSDVVAVGYATVKETYKLAFEKVEIEPSFPGGDTAWRKYLERNLNPAVMTENGAPPGVYSVTVLYIVNSNGSISDIRALTNHGYGMEAEAIRLIKNSPDWKPAIQNGKKVNAFRKQPITFHLIEDEKIRPQSGITETN